MRGKGQTQKTKSQGEKAHFKLTKKCRCSFSNSDSKQINCKDQTAYCHTVVLRLQYHDTAAATDETGALQCDRCMSNKIWKCADSLNLSSEMYHHQVSDCSPVLCWFCNNCEKIVMSINHNGTGQQNEKSTI